MILKLEKTNEEIIEKFNYDKYYKLKDYKMASSLNAINISNEIIKAYLKKEEGLDDADVALRVYALLQALFVSVDSLYQIALSLTSSKSFININSNKNLRELKYIRNDVVGHPSNRVVCHDNAYCILDYSNITKEKLCYTIYQDDGKKETKTVYIDDLIVSYYIESNNFLKELLNVNSIKQDKKELIDKYTSVIKRFYNYLDYKQALDEFIDLYMTYYPSANKSQHRVLWRYELICHLLRYNTKSKEEKDIILHAVRLELEKIYELVAGIPFSIEISRRLPRSISAFYHTLNRHPELHIYLDNLSNTADPLFFEAISKIYKVCQMEGNSSVVYLNMVIKAYKDLNSDLIYSLALPIISYKRK